MAHPTNDFYEGELRQVEGFPSNEVIGTLPAELEAYNANNKARNIGVVIVARGEKFTAYVRHYTTLMTGIKDDKTYSFWQRYEESETFSRWGKTRFTGNVKVALKIAKDAEATHLRAIEHAESSVEQFARSIRHFKQHNGVHFNFTDAEFASYDARVAKSYERLAIITTNRDAFTNQA